MDEEFIRNRITELRLKKGISEYQLSLELGQNRGYIQAISSGRALPSMKQFLNICEYFEITPLQFFDDTENTPQCKFRVQSSTCTGNEPHSHGDLAPPSRVRGPR